VTLGCILIPLFQQNNTITTHTNDHDVLRLSEIERLVEGDIFLHRNRPKYWTSVKKDEIELAVAVASGVTQQEADVIVSPFYLSQFFAI